MENCPILFLYGTYLPVAIMVFVIHTISFIYDSIVLSKGKKYSVFVCACVCVLSSHFFWTSGLWTYQPGSHGRKVTQEEGHTGFLHRSSAVLAFIFLTRRIQPFLSLVDREVEFSVLTN